MVDRITQVGILSLILLGALLGASLTTHEAYNEHTITIEGQPVDISEKTSQENVLNQADMTAKEYQAANHIMGNKLAIKTFPNGTAAGIQPPYDYQLDGLGNEITLTQDQAIEFTNYEYVQIDGHYYEISVETETHEPLGYFTFFEIIGALVWLLIGGMYLFKLIDWYEARSRR